MSESEAINKVTKKVHISQSESSVIGSLDKAEAFTFVSDMSMILNTNIIML